VIVPFVLIYAYGAEEAFLFIALTVFIGEAVCAGIGGTLLYPLLKRLKIAK
jgi:energy-converting hydrogenase Eha subunit B